MNELAVRETSLPLPIPLQHGEVQELRFFDWLVDGVSLREKYCEEAADSYMTLLQDDAWLAKERRESLQRLLGLDLPAPSLDPRYHRSRLDRMLGRKGTPYAPWGAAFEDGRVGLLFCCCGDLDCQTLSARIVVTNNTVEWHDIGWQVTYAPFGSEWTNQLDEYGHAVFDRTGYEAMLRELLAATPPPAAGTE